MKAKEQINQKIDEFLLGQMDEATSKEFWLELEKNETHMRDYKLRKAQKEGIEAYARKTLKSDLKVIHNKIESGTPGQNSSKNSNNWLYIILTLLSLSLLGYYLWNKTIPQKIEPTQLFAENFKPYKATNSRDLKSNADSIDIKMLLSYKLYREKQYAKATPVFESLINEHALVLSELNLLLGISYMASGELEKSQKLFLGIIERDDINFKDEATWQLAFSYLKENNIVKSKETLEILVADEESDHHEQAKILLKQLQ